MAVWTAIGAGVSALGSLLSNQASNTANANLNKENRDFQEKMQWQQNRWSEMMWNKENEYNTPLAQRERLKAAGYNPWISGSGGMSNVAQAPTSPGSQSAPPVAPMHYDNPFGNLAMTVNDTVRAKAESANQLSQAAQNAVNTSVALYEKTGDLHAASQYLSTSLKAVGGANFSKDSLYFQQFQLAVIGADLDNTQKKLDIDYSTLKNDIYSRYGAKEAESKIANLEQLTTKYVGELGLMSSQADLNRSEIALNEKRAYELGARAASEFAQAQLFGSEASINTGLANYLIGNANLSYLSNLMNTTDQLASFVGDTGKRSYIMSPEGQSRRTWNYKQSPEGNYVSSFMKGFVDNSNTSFNFGGNYNYSRSFNNSRGYTNSWIWNGRDFAPHP